MTAGQRVTIRSEHGATTAEIEISESIRAGAVRGPIEDFRRLTEALGRHAQQVDSLGMGRCPLLRELGQRGDPRLQPAKELRRFHGCSVSPARTSRSFQRWDAAEPQTDSAPSIGLSI